MSDRPGTEMSGEELDLWRGQSGAGWRVTGQREGDPCMQEDRVGCMVMVTHTPRAQRVTKQMWSGGVRAPSNGTHAGGKAWIHTNGGMGFTDGF